MTFFIARPAIQDPAPGYAAYDRACRTTGSHGYSHFGAFVAILTLQLINSIRPVSSRRSLVERTLRDT
jgi:hypothetical protein